MKRENSFFQWLLCMALAVALLYMPVQLATAQKRPMLETNIQEETQWQTFQYQYLGKGQLYRNGNHSFYLANNYAGYYLISVQQDGHTIERVTPIGADRSMIEREVERYNISQ